MMKYIGFFIPFLCLFFFSCQSIDEPGLLVPPTVDEDSDLPQIQIEVAGYSRGIHLQTFGEEGNPVLFILHGTYSGLNPYRSIAESLSEKYFVVLYDQRGAGLSERITEEEFTLDSATEALRVLKSRYAPDDKVTLVGHSWGGGLATLFTSNYPESVEQLVLVEPMALTGDDMQEVFHDIVDFSYFEGPWNESSRHGQALSPNDHAQVDFRARMILLGASTPNYFCDSDNPPDWNVHRVGAFLEYVRNKRLGNPQSGFHYDFRAGIEKFQDDVLILGGSCSSLGFEMQRTYSQPHFQNAEVVEINEAGHRMHVEKFAEVLIEIKNYLTQF